jgi:hypothetical protein
MATAKKAKKATARKAAPAKPASRAGAKPTPEPATRPGSTAAAAEAAKAPKSARPKKPKLVRDSFTIPKAEYTVIDQLKRRAAQLGTPAKKSEVLRAGLKVLAGMEDAAFVAARGAVPALKTGRPAKS